MAGGSGVPGRSPWVRSGLERRGVLAVYPNGAGPADEYVTVGFKTFFGGFALMAALITETGLEVMLRMLINDQSQDDLVLHLYEAAHTPAITDDVGDLSPLECSLMGYAEVTLNPSLFAFNFASNTVSLIYPPVDFTFSSGPGNIYGYYVTLGPGTGPLICLEEAASPIAIGGGGGSVTVSVQLQNKNC